MKLMSAMLPLISLISLSTAAMAAPLAGDEAEAYFQAGRQVAQGAEMAVDQKSVKVDAYNKFTAPQTFYFDKMVLKNIDEKTKEATVDLYFGEMKLQPVKLQLEEVGWDTKEDSRITGYHLKFGKKSLEFLLGAPVEITWSVSVGIYKDALGNADVTYIMKNQNPWMMHMDYAITGVCKVAKKAADLE